MASNRGLIITVVVLALLVAVVAFSFSGDDSPAEVQQPSESSSEWMSFSLTDVNSGEAFTIQELNDKPILLESFAVWCPTCTRQQKKIKELHEEIGEDVISISIDTDPNEDASRILQHTQSNGFNWRYSISPPELSQLLIDEFGIGIVNAPSAPVVLICPGGSFRQLPSGVKDVQELKEALASCGG